MICSLIQRIPSHWEPVVLVIISLGYFIYTSYSLVLDIPATATYTFTNSDALFLIIYEICALCFVGWFLKVRGYQLYDFGWEITWILTGAGFLLFFVDYTVYMIVAPVLEEILKISKFYVHSDYYHEATLTFTLAMIVINSTFEEFIVSAYLITVLTKHHGMMFAIGASVLVRLLYHTYQGPEITVHILPMGILFAFVYWKWKKLWPLIMAHSIWNIMVMT